ncbi:hypothetical protein MHYP_G00334900 [Metynnis hypsauchen]
MARACALHTVSSLPPSNRVPLLFVRFLKLLGCTIADMGEKPGEKKTSTGKKNILFSCKGHLRRENELETDRQNVLELVIRSSSAQKRLSQGRQFKTFVVVPETESVIQAEDV